MILQKLSQLVGPLPLSLLRVTGPARFGGEDLCALYAGNGSNLDFLTRLFFQQVSCQTLAQSLHPFAVRTVLKKAATDENLVLAELPPLWAPLLQRADTIRFPAWMRQEVVLTGGSRWLLSRRIEREVARHVRREGYVIDFTAAEEAMRVFFRRFYRPYVHSRFGPGAIVAEEGEFMSRCRGQTLARLHARRGWVAGLLLRRRGSTLRFGKFGAATDPPAPGASEVLDALVIQEMHARGVRHIVLGDSRPSLADGVVRYKARFGASPAPTLFPQPILSVQVRHWSAGISEALRQQPLVTFRQGEPHVYRTEEHSGRIRVKIERAAL